MRLEDVLCEDGTLIHLKFSYVAKKWVLFQMFSAAANNCRHGQVRDSLGGATELITLQ